MANERERKLEWSRKLNGILCKSTYMHKYTHKMKERRKERDFHILYDRLL